MGYDRFCKTYQRHVLVVGAASRVGHKAGQTVEVDWSGKTMQLTDPVSGVTRVYLFVATLPFSRYSFVEPTLDMKQDTWLRANTAMMRDVAAQAMARRCPQEVHATARPLLHQGGVAV